MLNPELPYFFFFLLDVFVGPFFFFDCSVLFWFHISPLALPVKLLVMRHFFFYCQSLEIRLSPHTHKWRQWDVFVCCRSCNSRLLQFRLRTLATQSRVLMFLYQKGCTSFSRKATTDLLDRTKSQYSVFSVWWGSTKAQMASGSYM